MTDVTYIWGAAPDDASPAEPNLAVVWYLENMLERARSGDIRGVVTVDLDGDGCAAYGVVGSVGGFSMQGALACASAVISDVNLSGPQDE